MQECNETALHTDGIDHEYNWAKWVEGYRERLEREKTEREKPFLEHIKPHLDKATANIDRERELYKRAHESRNAVLAAWSEKVKSQLHESKLIPSYCGIPHKIESLEARNEELHRLFLKADEGRNILMLGGVGVGKTYAAVQMLYRWCQQNFRYGLETDVYKEVKQGVKPKPCILNFHEYEQSRNKTQVDFPRFVNAKMFFHELRATYDGENRNKGSEQMVMDKYLRPPLLVFDDLGAEKTSDWTRDKVLTLLEMRLYDPRKQTIITTNLSISGKIGNTPTATISQVIDDRLASRMQEQCACYPLVGEDLRITKGFVR